MTPVTRSERALIISRIPAGEFSFDNLDALGSLITQELTNILVEQAGADREVWERLALGEDVEPTLGQWRTLDEEIIFQAETLGWMIGESHLVKRRFEFWEKWHPCGPELVERYGAALTSAARIYHKQKKPPIDVWMEPAKAQIKDELTQVFMVLRAAKPSTVPAAERFQTVVRDHDCVLLAANEESWQAFFQANPLELTSRMDGQNPIAAVGLFESWLSFHMGYQPETLRKKIGSFPVDSTTESNKSNK